MWFLGLVGEVHARCARNPFEVSGDDGPVPAAPDHVPLSVVRAPPVCPVHDGGRAVAAVHRRAVTAHGHVEYRVRGLDGQARGDALVMLQRPLPGGVRIGEYFGHNLVGVSLERLAIGVPDVRQAILLRHRACGIARLCHHDDVRRLGADGEIRGGRCAFTGFNRAPRSFGRQTQ